jgi:hypothetical protein
LIKVFPLWGWFTFDASVSIIGVQLQFNHFSVVLGGSALRSRCNLGTEDSPLEFLPTLWYASLLCCSEFQFWFHVWPRDWVSHHGLVLQPINTTAMVMWVDASPSFLPSLPSLCHWPHHLSLVLVQADFDM